MLATRVYAFVLVMSLAAVVAVEVVPREMGRLSRFELAKRQHRFEITLDDMTARIGRDEVEAGDEIRLAAVKAELAGLRTESRVRAVSTVAFVLLALSSLAFALLATPRVLFGKRIVSRSGTIEVEPDETITIDASDVAHEVGRLHTSRKAAIDHLLSQVSLHCASCAWLWKPDVLGRIGRRIFIRRMPEGASMRGEALGEGWWSRPVNPPSCPKCGGRDLLPD